MNKLQKFNTGNWRVILAAETETIPPPSKTKPTTIPKKVPPAPTKDPRENPFRKPNIEPGKGPQPKALPIQYPTNIKARIHPELQTMINEKNTPYHALPTVPGGDFIANISNDRFSSIIQAIKKYSGVDVKQPQDIIPALSRILSKIQTIESEFTSSLEDLAVRLVENYFGIETGEVQFDAHLMQSVDISDITNLEAPKAQEAVNNLSNINLEVSKRRFINGLIQGAGINSLTMFHMVGDELNSLDPDLLNMYGLLAALIEYGYWVTSPNIGAMSLSNAAAGGKVQLDLKNEEPKIIAQSMTFPILVQELVKGVMELMSAGGLPEDSNTRDSVLSQADSLQDESWDIRFGPEIWKKLVSSLSVNDLNNRALSILYRNTVELDSATFSDFMHDILSKKPEALQKWNNMYQSALTQVNNSKTSSIRGHVLDIYSKYDEYHKNQLNTGKTPELFHIWINKVK